MVTAQQIKAQIKNDDRVRRINLAMMASPEYRKEIVEALISWRSGKGTPLDDIIREYKIKT